MAIIDRGSASSRLAFLLSQDISGEEEAGGITDKLTELTPTAPDIHEETRKLLEKVVELARRPVDMSGMPAPQVNVQPATVHLPAPQVTVNAAVAASAVPWMFEFERFPNGAIKAIHATPRKLVDADE